MAAALVSQLGIGCKKESIEPTLPTKTTSTLSGVAGSKDFTTKLGIAATKRIIKNELYKKDEDLENKNKNKKNDPHFSKNTPLLIKDFHKSQTFPQMEKLSYQHHARNTTYSMTDLVRYDLDESIK